MRHHGRHGHCLQNIARDAAKDELP
jgi:hypothetical protein